MRLANHKSQRQSSSVQTTSIPFLSQKRLKQPKTFLKVVYSFVSFSMVKMCHNPMHLTNHKSQRWSSSVQTTFIPFLSQKRVKPTKNCLEVVNGFNSVSMVKMCHNPMHLTNHKCQRQSNNVQTIFIPILSQKRIKPTKKCLETVNTFLNVSMVKHLSQSKAFDKLYELEMDQECLDNTYNHFVPKVVKTNKKLLKSSKQLCKYFYGQTVSQSKVVD